jgi:hypothetical protein
MVIAVGKFRIAAYGDGQQTHVADEVVKAAAVVNKTLRRRIRDEDALPVAGARRKRAGFYRTCNV